MQGRSARRRAVVAFAATMVLGLALTPAAHADEPVTVSAQAGVQLGDDGLAAGLTLALWLPSARRQLDELLGSGTAPAPATLAEIEATLERLLAGGAPTDPALAQALNEVLTSLRVLIERLIADPTGTSAAVIRSLVTRFNELSGAAGSGGSGASGGNTTITVPSAGVLGTRASSRVTQRRALVTRMRASKTRRSVRVTVRCPAQAARTCQVALRARVRARTASASRRIAVRSGSSRTITIRLTRAGSQRLRRGGRLSAVATTRFGTTALTSSRAISVSRIRG